MTKQEREELIEKMAHEIGRYNNYAPWTVFVPEASAALDVAEPVIREKCARIAASHNGCEISIREGQWCEAVNEIAAAILEGGKE